MIMSSFEDSDKKDLDEDGSNELLFNVQNYHKPTLMQLLLVDFST